MYKIKNTSGSSLNIITEKGSYFLKDNESLDLDGICSRTWIYSNVALKRLLTTKKLSVVYDSVVALQKHKIEQKPPAPAPQPVPSVKPDPVTVDYNKFTVLIVAASHCVPGRFVYLIRDLNYSNMKESVYSSAPVNILDSKCFPAFGVITRKETDRFYRVQFAGQTPDVFSGLLLGKRCFIGSGGFAVNTVPKIAGKRVHVQYVGNAISSKSIYINMSDNVLVIK